MFSEDIDPEALDMEQYQETDVLRKYPTNARGLIDLAEITEASDVEPLKPLLRYIDGMSGRATDFLARGTLTMINGQKGCRKSTFVRAICKILLNGELSEDNPHTLTAKIKGLKVAMIDTEQHKSRLNNVRLWLQKSYTGKEPFAERFKIYEGCGKSRETLHIMAVNICEYYRPDVLVLDVISHFVNDINNQETAQEEVAFINQLCKRYDVAIIGLIHQNPSREPNAADRMTGALGTQLLRAAECVLNVARAAEGTERVDDVGEAWPSAPFLYGRGSVIEFTEYRERWPELKNMFLMNENDKGAFELSLHPARKETKKIKADTKSISIDTLYFVPCSIVTNMYKAIAREELEMQQRKFNFPNDEAEILTENKVKLPF